MPIYVEIRIRAAFDELWRMTQQPELHERWDLRFSRIEYLPRDREDDPQRFFYTTRIGLGLKISGGGESVGSRADPQGCRSSALKFWSDDWKSLIREGAGYWQYIPTADGIRFLTSYDYRVRFGAVGRFVDRLLFRPAIGWATAWSFDRLRLWLEKGIDPKVSLRRSLIHCLARVAVAFHWLYHGLILNLLLQHRDALAPVGQADPSTTVLTALAYAETACALLVLWRFRSRWPLGLSILLAVADAAVKSPHPPLASFGPASLNVVVMALALVGVLANRDLPTASRTLRRKPADAP